MGEVINITLGFRGIKEILSMWGLLLYTIFNNNVIYLEFNSQHGSQIGIIANIIADALNFET